MSEAEKIVERFDAKTPEEHAAGIAAGRRRARQRIGEGDRVRLVGFGPSDLIVEVTRADEPTEGDGYALTLRLVEEVET
jgi:hypothetical protein